ncbi:serine/threonine-protein kinase [Nonomuraea spiralis]|uniref:non-specific serine/threonine protein kinase n=1 Tax=Nonomuraea spiralis TaxID=46182 RepID=A0ABV5I8T8_9ACTN|nr:serine/threonine-protein kinase [Nonomuraea spiralis]GGS75898.1 hypothetical protein GCM10010176_018610 [Nonomuraea spiralis]
MTMPPAIGPYLLVRQLGEGGQGAVYLAEAPDGARVAIKVLHEGASGDGRFAKEVAAARRVEPFCVAQVLDASLGGRPYIVTEYVEGPSLQQAGRHAGADLQRLAVATATALAAIHRAGVVHRDFKPANVLLGRDGPRVIDFGIARAADASATVTSSILGTPSYMAPEQFAGATVGPATDVFAWACVMVYAATGVPPFGNDSVPAVLGRIQYGEPQLAGVPEPLRSIVAACLAKHPDARPTMQDVLFQLIGGPRPTPPPSPGRPAAPHVWTGPSGRPPAGPTHPSAHGHPRHPAGGRPRTGLALLAGGVALVLTAATATAVWVWWPTAPGRNTTNTTNAAAPPTTHVPDSRRSGTRRSTTRKPAKPTRSPQPTTTRPTPTTKPTSARPTPTKPTSTAKPTTTRPTTPAKGGVTSAALTYQGIRVGGCWRYDLNVYADVTTTVGYDYQWLVNGQSQGRKVATASTRPVLPSITWKGKGSYTVVFRVLTPTSLRRSVTVNICDVDKGW